ncbi:unnamed protein product [Alopecurus aequalis]
MDSIVRAICFVIAFVSITAIVTKMAIKSMRSDVMCSKPVPPVVNVITLLRLLPAIITTGLPATINYLYENFGNVFTVSIFGRNMTFLIGPELSQHFFHGMESEISHGNLMDFTVPMLGQHVAYAVDSATRKQQRGFYIDALTKPEALRSHVDPMLQEVEVYFSKWGQVGMVDLKHELGHLIMIISSRRLLGKEVRGKMFDEFYSLIHCVEKGFSFFSVIFPYIPIPAHNRRDRARVRLQEIFSEVIRSRRNSNLVEDDVIQKLIEAKYNDGRCTTEEEVAGMVLSLLFGGEHTSSHASTWTGACLLNNAKWLSAAVEEQKKIIREYKETIDYNSLLEMDVLHRCIKEALRMHPTAPLLLRKAHKPFSVQTKQGNEYEIPAEHTVVVPLLTNTMMPSIFKDPHVYDPDRFANPGRKEDKVGGRDSYVPFGSGRNACIGEGYVYLLLKIIWSHLLRNFELKLVSPYPKTDWSSFTPGPKGKVLVGYTRRHLHNA